ncbi:hypothetical protein V1477_019655 [Vespula maculifrons]|uniref:Uncharacterized protein n=1 Tax=Vespula maculifrons TaxID=7453 RepID=A0ABD2AR14_VESMC
MLTLVATEEAFNPAVNQCENADPTDFTANPLETQEAPKRRPRKGHTEGCSSSVAKKKNEVFESKWNEDERYEKLSITKKQIWKEEEAEEEEEEKRANKQPRKAQANVCRFITRERRRINVGIFLTTFRTIRAVTGEPRRKYLSATAIATATATATVTATALSHTKTRSFLIEEGYIPENLDRIPHTVSSTDYLPQSLTDYPKTTPLGELCPR